MVDCVQALRQPWGQSSPLIGHPEGAIVAVGGAQLGVSLPRDRSGVWALVQLRREPGPGRHVQNHLGRKQAIY